MPNSYDDTIVVTLHNTEDLFRIMYIKLAPILNKLKKWSSSVSISLQFVSINFAEANEKHDEIYYKTEITKILKLLKQANIRVVFCIDEVSNTPAIQKLAEKFNNWSLSELQVSVIMTGLLKEVAELSSSYNLTFLVRADRFHINKLQKLSIAQTYIKVFDITSDQAEEMAEMAQGYAYTFQLIGDLMYEELPTGKNFEEMGKSKQYVNMYRTKLIKYDLIKTIIRGKLGFTLPLFREFIQAKYDELNWG